MLNINIWKFLNESASWRNTSRKVAGSILYVEIGFFHSHNPSDRTMALGSNQLIKEMFTRNNSLGGKGGRRVGLTTISPSYAKCLEIWEPELPETLRACSGLYMICFTCN